MWLCRHTATASRHWRLRELGRQRFTRWFLGFAMLMLIGQQTALASYECAMAPSSVATVMAMTTPAAMAAMAKTCPGMRGMAGHALCQKHCNPDNTAHSEPRPGTVPPSLFAPLPPLLPATAMEPLLAGRTSRQAHLQQAPPPSATLLFCSLLI
jgi:hypothetical protein